MQMLEHEFPKRFGLAWMNARCPPKPLYHSPSSTG